MSLPLPLNDREYQKFIDIAPGETAVRVSGANFSGTVSISGLSIAGKISTVTINSITWTALPLASLTARNGISVHNQTNTQMKINYDNTEPGYVGPIINSGGERYYDIRDTIILYGKCQAGTIDVVIEELS